ncbi:MAG: response regulator transcription factor [Saprospiraceae bacterium]|jgi:two-component system alkaline phosphatase synthesis response regulator PhoP|uniref:response regulator transcription factor n=1 Tax=Candidatus Brachybacter algidus TaxID=2982024 RepID=UPI002579AA94|nr:response regulator transcription factor [Candidatus Brachybacter algidus]HQW70797.1 response regulator transcription factor [Saprospiraceae bacterium]
MTQTITQMASRILIVDDEEDIREILQFNLRKEGYVVEVAKSGKEALKIADEFLPDLIVLDLMMPEMDGVEVCKILRQNELHNDTIIAFLTARNEDYTQVAALDTGGDDFISKPIKPMVLISRIKALLRRTTNSEGHSNKHISIINNLTINREQHVVMKDGQKIDLAKKEFQLLNLMISKPGKVFTRDEIFRKIWGNDVIVGNRTIDVHIRKIREKIGEEIIKTVKGIGYKFDF